MSNEVTLTKAQVAGLRVIADGGAVSTRLRNILFGRGLLLSSTTIDYSKPLDQRTTTKIILSGNGERALAALRRQEGP